MRAEEGDESIEELAKDAAKAEDELERATDKTVDKAGPATKPAHRQGVAPTMARGEHPQRTPFCGVPAFRRLLSCWLAASVSATWLSIAIYVVAAVIAWIGFLMTFRDYSPSSRRPPHR